MAIGSVNRFDRTKLRGFITPRDGGMPPQRS
jgi:cold shock CspA family protein